MTRSRSSRLAALLSAFAALAAVLAVSGCGEKEERAAGGAERFDLMLDFFVNPDHVGIYQALSNGEFESAGLDVRAQIPSDPSAPIKQVAAGQVDLAISYEPEVMLARDQGLDVVAVAALVQSPLTSMISLPDAGIDEPADLAGKTIVTAGIPYQDAFLKSILSDAGVDSDEVESVNVGFNLQQPLLSGRAEAMLGGFLNVEGVDLAEQGENPKVVPVDQLGIPTYNELVLVASGEQVRQDAEMIRLFIAALEQGTADAIADPEGATDELLAAADGLDPELTLAQVKGTLPLLEPVAGKPYGYMDPQAWTEFAGFMADQGLLEVRPEAGSLLTNSLLPGQIPR